MCVSILHVYDIASTCMFYLYDACIITAFSSLLGSKVGNIVIHCPNSVLDLFAGITVTLLILLVSTVIRNYLRHNFSNFA